jgi:hypothetical protein|tara:strand:- start:4766 stop:5002 length:237 start_codon:yes stop_codon:yes gene_type:complete
MKSQIINNCLNVLKSDEMKKELKDIISPLVNFIIKEFSIYLILLIFFIFSSFALHLGILIILLKNNKNNKNFISNDNI